DHGFDQRRQAAFVGGHPQRSDRLRARADAAPKAAAALVEGGEFHRVSLVFCRCGPKFAIAGGGTTPSHRPSGGSRVLGFLAVEIWVAI
ncbi:MAG: hypothetical protein ACK6C0_04710, partial [Betaproteobacteria bacterium]